MSELLLKSIEFPQIRVLLIEDNLAEARFIQEIFKDSQNIQFEIAHVNRLGSAIIQLGSANFDVALLDLTLPDSSGLASLDAAIHHAPNLPIVVLTYHNDDELAIEAVRRGAQDYLVKRQVNLDVLVRSIRYAIERKQAAVALREINETLESRVEERTAALEAANQALNQEIESRESIQNRLALAQQAGKIGTFEWDLSTDKIAWSLGLEALYGLESGSFGDNFIKWLTTIHPEDRPEVRAKIESALNLKQGLDLEFRIEYPDDSIHWITVKSNIFPDLNGNPTRTIGIHMDITEKKQLEAQFLRTQRLESLGTLASGIAHDLNNILTPILSVAQLLPLRVKNLDTRTQHLLKILETSARRGADLIKQILSFAQGVEGKHICIQPSHLVVEIQKIIQQTLPKSIEIGTSIPSDLGLVWGDMTQLHQVLMNLCINARDAMPQGGTLTIEASNKSIDETFVREHFEATVGNYVTISVIDTGSGIQPQLLHRIFDPFFTTKEVGKGTGLGLSAVLGIIKSHGGFLDVQSQVNSGTQIVIYLPACPPTHLPHEDESELPIGQQQLVLVVDDELAIGELIKTTLETYNYRVISASNGRDAISIYLEHQDEIEAVLIDLMMPVMDGLTTVTALHQLKPDLPVIAISGLNSIDAVAKAKRFGCEYFLAKPFTNSELLEILSQSVRSSRKEATSAKSV
jgi:two-component system, cell cycle sensor histidine kinase and response regulator CckA